jgi:hypothetical protein
MSEQGDTSTGTYAAGAELSPQPAGRSTERVHREEAQSLTPESVALAVVELTRLAIELEQRFHQDPSIVAYDRHAQREVHSRLKAQERLRIAVHALLKYRDERRALVDQVRAARVASEISNFVKTVEGESRKERLRSEKLSNNRPRFSAEQRQQIGKFIEESCARAELPLDASQRDKIVAAAVGKGGKGRFHRIADEMYRVQLTPVKARTSQSILSALEGREQRIGQVRLPKEAELIHDYDPLATFYMLEYLSRHAEKGLHGFIGDGFKALDQESRRAEVASWLRKIADELTTPRPPQGEPSSTP